MNLLRYVLRDWRLRHLESLVATCFVPWDGRSMPASLQLLERLESWQQGVIR
jgi:hypothetical protein